MDQSPGHHELARRDWIRAEQTRALYRGSPVGVAAGGLAAITLAVFLERDGRMATEHAVAFCAMTVACVSVHFALCFGFRRRDPPDRAWRPWAAAFTIMAAVEGATWVPGAVWMTSPHDTAQALIVLLVSGMLVLGALPVFSSFLPAYLAFAIPIVMPQVVLAFVRTYPLHELLAVLTLTFLVAAPALALVVGRQFVEGLGLRFENMSLIEDLRLQSARADQANRAKSSFLAAASHDLRQPVHALGLFVGALGEQRLGGEARRLTDHIAGSVGALDTLFTVLLDVSKLDAGAVEVRPETLRVGPMLERLAQDYAGQAAAKGVALRVVGCSAVVVSDPVLLERVLRNLISNAVKYTDTGRVLVGCRRRAGQVVVEVLDTGRGIAPDQIELVFEEFHQVDNPGRDRAKGLGLGLSIVRRITPLIGADLELRSEVGRGSVFRLALPRGAAKDLPALATSGLATTGALRTGLILVIDDEAAIRQAMSSVLGGWGHQVRVAGSAGEMLVQLGDGGRPDLIICDYRLPGGETGVTAIRQLRAAIGRDVPAMLVTGEIGEDQLRDAEASGHLVLHKPVPNARLRAAIGQLLRGGD